MNDKFRYVIFDSGTYRITVEDYNGDPYTFEVSGEEIAAHFRREKLLEKQIIDLQLIED